jgi:NAD(P)-dependent dehydrogenase (short-subunit alcohol dehydrogenase family)
MQTDLDGKVAIVTGGARGIGRAYAQGIADAGAAVLVVDLLEDEGRETVKAIEAAGGRAQFLNVDVTDQASTEAMAATAASEFGGVDILVNNAAMFASLRGGAMIDIGVDRWDRTMAVNVKGPWLCLCAVLPHMRARGGGAVVNQSSIAAFGLGGMLDYSTSKAALIGFTKNAALELGRDNVRVNAIAPGGVATEANAMITGDSEFTALAERAKVNQAIGVPIQPDDLVATVLYLVSDSSKLVTGQTIVVDGGRFFLG